MPGSEHSWSVRHLIVGTYPTERRVYVGECSCGWHTIETVSEMGAAQAVLEHVHRMRALNG